MQDVIKVENLSKSFKVHRPLSKIKDLFRFLFAPKSSFVEAIQNISFSIKEGERVGFIGPNGAGKSTTIKMLTGILYPTNGSINVLGYIPWKARKQLGYHIGTVFGQRTQLWYNLPPKDTFDLLAKIYDLEKKNYQRRLEELLHSFQITHLLYTPVRQLSLGQRMRCEIVASLLHNPKILFLDEPTIGLDVNAKLKVREIVNQMSKQYGTTLFLTSHDTADIEQICQRVIILHEGKILRDGSLQTLKQEFGQKKIVHLTTEAKRIDLSLPGLEIKEQKDYSFVCEIDMQQIAIEELIHKTLQITSLKDVTIKEPPMEEIIRNLYMQHAKIS